jgi:hypothetical protein
MFAVGALLLASGACASPAPPRAAPPQAVTAKPEARGVDRGAVAETLEELQEDASRCGTAGAPVGQGKATIVFDPTTGGIADAKVGEAPFGGTGVGACVERVFRAAKVPPFQGSPLTVNVPFFVAQANGPAGFSVRGAKSVVREAMTHCPLKVQTRDVVADELRVHFKQSGTVSEVGFYRSDNHGAIDESNVTRCVRGALKDAHVAAFSSDEERASVRMYFTPI